MHPPSQAELAGLSILLVDANTEHRTIARLQLEACGAAVREVATPADALAALEHEESDAVVTELHFGRREMHNGWRVPSDQEGIALVKDVRAAHGIPVTVLTTLALPPNRVQAYAAGCNEFVAKPYPLRTLCSALLRSTSPRPALR